jgi:hypothetical protein
MQDPQLCCAPATEPDLGRIAAALLLLEENLVEAEQAELGGRAGGRGVESTRRAGLQITRLVRIRFDRACDA